ncbi:MAG: phosphoglucosamine mutase [Gemmatimonadetes bacterium]|nr:phosphoglucosamine mutase [Gemmatimonadota bacterium]
MNGDVWPAELIVSASGIRGRVGECMTPEVACAFAAAFGSFVQERGWGNRIALARDSRVSGPVLASAVSAGLQATGCDVLDLGLVPTPTALFALARHGLAGGIVVTASHNPVDWNALKLAGPDGAFLNPREAAAFLEYARDGRRRWAGWSALGARREVGEAVDLHLRAILGIPYLDVDLIRSAHLTVVVDCVRGAAGVIIPRLLDNLGCEVVGIDLQPDGRFPRDPEPVPANLGALVRAVREAHADLGMAFDPDGDRLALVSNRGVAIGEDYTLALAARLVLGHRRGPVVTNFSTSRLMDDACEEAGVVLYRTPVGEANVAARIREVDAVVGGEGNGGVILPEVHYTRDGPLGAALILQLIAETGAPLSEIVAWYPRYAIVKERLPRAAADLEAVCASLVACFPGAEADRQDGLRLDWRERRSWVHVRPSATEPILRIVAEAPTREEADALVAEMRRALARLASDH